MNDPLTRRLILSGLLASLATSARAITLEPDKQERLDKAIASLQMLKSVKGRFTQSGNGGASQGTLYLKRPGLARFEYDAPSELTIISDGRTVAISDTRQKTFSRAPLGSTPLSIFLAQDIQVARGVEILKVDVDGTNVEIAARDSRRRGQGQITLLFGGDPLAIRGWNLNTNKGQNVRVRLSDLRSTSLPASLFQIKAPVIAKGGSRP